MREKIREAIAGDATLRLFKVDGGYKGAVIVGKTMTVVEGSDPDDVWRRMHDEAGKANPKYFGFDGARNRFLHFFPNGFHAADYAERERDYKIAAKSKLDLTAPIEDAATGAGFGELILAVFRATNLLSPFEKTRLQDVLREPNADLFIQAAAILRTLARGVSSRELSIVSGLAEDKALIVSEKVRSVRQGELVTWNSMGLHVDYQNIASETIQNWMRLGDAVVSRMGESISARSNESIPIVDRTLAKLTSFSDTLA